MIGQIGSTTNRLLIQDSKAGKQYFVAADIFVLHLGSFNRYIWDIKVCILDLKHLACSNDFRYMDWKPMLPNVFLGKFQFNSLDICKLKTKSFPYLTTLSLQHLLIIALTSIQSRKYVANIFVYQNRTTTKSEQNLQDYHM